MQPRNAAAAAKSYADTPAGLEFKYRLLMRRLALRLEVGLKKRSKKK